MVGEEDMQTTENSVGKKKIVIGVIIGVIVIVAIVLVVMFADNDNKGELLENTIGSITRSFSASEIGSGEIFSVSYNIHLESGQRFYTLEDKVPDGFEILDCVHSQNNKIKLYSLEATENEVQNCAIKAPSLTGTYAFSGEYSFEGLDNLASVEGENSIVVK